MKKLKVFLTALSVPVLGAAISLGSLASAASDVSTNSSQSKDELKKAHIIAKTEIPKDPRGPLPKSAAEWDQWIKQHPDQSSKSGSTTVTPMVTQKQFPLYLLDNGDLALGASPYGGSSSSVPYGYFRHSGMYVNAAGQFISAMPNVGVEYESVYWWETSYGDVSLNWVPSSTSSQRYNVVTNATYHLGEPYYWTSSKTDTTSWYCSKLSWFEYNKWANIDIDNDGGYWVTPDDEYYSDNVSQYWRG